MESQLPCFSYISSADIHGYRPFRQFRARLGPIKVLVGANGSGKSSLLAFLRFLRDAVREGIPPEIVAGSAGQQLFHRPGQDIIQWTIRIQEVHGVVTSYYGEIQGPKGQTQVLTEQVTFEGASRFHQGPRRQKVPAPSAGSQTGQSETLLRRRGGTWYLAETATGDLKRQDIDLRRPNQLALGLMTNPAMPPLYTLREYVTGWRFYDSFDIENASIRASVPIEQDPVLHEDGGNLSAVLFYLMTEHPLIFDDLKTHVRNAVPGFQNLSVKARGGPGEVIAFWQEEGVDGELSLADLSDGILRFLCWTVLCLTPQPPSLICIDEPDQGVHPRTLPILAGLFRKASSRTQLLLATHSSFFLTQFDIESIAIMKKVGGESVYVEPSDSKALLANLNEFGISELEIMHRSDELEALT